jgi:taurine dioxygenase
MTTTTAAKQDLRFERVPMKNVRVNFWHSDGTLFECPPQAAMLTPVEVPETGGDTMWPSMYAAWEDLSLAPPAAPRGRRGAAPRHRLPFLKDTPKLSWQPP